MSEVLSVSGPTGDAQLKALRSIAVASAAKVTASRLSHLPCPSAPKAVHADSCSMPSTMPPTKRRRCDTEAQLEAVPSSEIEQAGTRKIMCTFWLQGTCAKGNECKFSHGDAENEGGNPSELMVSTMQVPAGCAGLIIGKGGQGVKTIEVDCGVSVRLTDDDMFPDQRICVLTGGDERSQARARSLIERTMRYAQDASLQGPRNHEETIEVPEKLVAQLIGKQGANLKKVRETTGCKVHVEQVPTLKGTSFRTVHLEGTYKAVAIGREQLERQILDCCRNNQVFDAELENKFQSQPFGSPPAETLTSVAGSGIVSPSMGKPDESSAVAAKQLQKVSIPAISPHSDMDYFQVLAQWAVFYARESSCISYYTSLRSSAAKVYCKNSQAYEPALHGAQQST